MRQTHHIVPTFTEDQIRALLRRPDFSTFTGFRDYTVMGLMLDTGVRIGELLAVKLEDLVIEVGIPQEIKIKNPKSRKERVLPLSPQIQGIVRQYLEIRQETFDGFNLPYFFPNVDCGNLGIRSTEERIKE